MRDLELEDLPCALLVKIFENLECDDIAQVRLLNKAICTLAKFAVHSLKPIRSSLLKLFPNARKIDLTSLAEENWDSEALTHLKKVKHLKLGKTPLNSDGAKIIGSLATLRSLELLESGVTDNAVGHWSALVHLTSLFLRDCHNLTDDGLQMLPNLKSLKELDLGACWKLSDATITVLSSLPCLEKIDLTGCERLSNAGLAALSKASTLRTLLLPACWQLDDASMELIAKGLPQLECLGLFESGEQVTDAGLKKLTALQHLTALDLGYSCWRHTSNGLCEMLPAMKSLRMLNIGGAEGVSDAVLAAAAELTQLTMLDLSECQRISARGIKHLAALPHLSDLNLGWNLRLEDAALTALAAGTGSLTRLDLSFCAALTDKALAAIAGVVVVGNSGKKGGRKGGKSGGLPCLNVLILRKCGLITDEGLGYLAHCPSLTHLDLSYSGPGVSPKALKHLSTLPHLQHLTLISCHMAVTVTGLSALAAAPALLHVDLSDNKRMDDGGMQALSLSRSVQHLILRSCSRVSDHGLIALARMPTLRKLVLDGCHRLSQKGVDALCVKLPRLHRTVTAAPGGAASYSAYTTAASALETMVLSSQGNVPEGGEGLDGAGYNGLQNNHHNQQYGIGNGIGSIGNGMGQGQGGGQVFWGALVPPLGRMF